VAIDGDSRRARSSTSCSARPAAQPIVLTPGGRFSKDVPGLRPAGPGAGRRAGWRVLIWGPAPNLRGLGRPSFYGRLGRSHMRAGTLAELAHPGLDMAPGP